MINLARFFMAAPLSSSPDAVDLETNLEDR